MSSLQHTVDRGALKIKLNRGSTCPCFALTNCWTAEETNNNTVCPYRYCSKHLLHGEQIHLFSSKMLRTTEWRRKSSALVLHYQVSKINWRQYTCGAIYSVIVLWIYKPMGSVTPVQRTNTCVQTQDTTKDERHRKLFLSLNCPWTRFIWADRRVRVRQLGNLISVCAESCCLCGLLWTN